MIKLITNYLYEKRVKKAIRKANTLKSLTHYKYFVIVFKGKPMVVPKRDIKYKIASGFFKKGTTIQDIERAAIYKTL